MAPRTVRRIQAEAARPLEDLVVPVLPPSAGHLQPAQAKQGQRPEKFPQPLAPLPAELELALARVEPVLLPAARELLWFGVASERLALCPRLSEEYEEFSFSPWPFAGKALVARQVAPGAAEPEAEPAEPMRRRDPAR
jgi:hypothetical protein